MCQINKTDTDKNELQEKASEVPEISHEDNPSPMDADVSLESKEELPIGAKELLEGLIAEVNQLPETEQKLQKVIEFMELTLAQKGTPHFKSFWEARNLCVDLFKQNIPSQVKQNLWNKYIDLSKEARRLREILDEQSAFAAEQIELAIHALENELADTASSSSEAELPEIPLCRTIESKWPFYEKCQKELNFLNAQASRITALRKELIRTNMRIRTKNKFFQRLSLAGDKVFPKRKELIKDISQQFLDDIEQFVAHNFSSEINVDSLHDLREEIKALQYIAKILTLNTHAFTHTRLKLSECWDKVKTEEKERKKVRIQQKAAFRQNFDEIQAFITPVSEALTAGTLSIEETRSKIDEIVKQMRQVELGHEELKSLRQNISDIRKALDDKIQAEEQKRQSIEDEKERVRRIVFDSIVNEIDSLFAGAESLDMDSIVHQKGVLQNKIAEASLTKKEKLDLEKRLKSIQDIISEKRERAILSLSDDDRHTLNQLQELLNEKKEKRQEIKEHIESLRKKSKGSSGMDFEQAMQSSSQLEIERANLDKVNASIQEIEEKIEELEYK